MKAIFNHIHIKKIIPGVFREDTNYSISERSIALLGFMVGMLSLLVGVPTNFYINASWEVHTINFITIIFFLIIFYLIEKKKISSRYHLKLFIPINLILIVLYFQEEGAKGSAFLFWLCMTQFLAVLEQRSKYIMFFVNLLIISALIYIHLNFPYLISHHDSTRLSIINIYIVTITSFIYIFILASYTINNHTKEKERVAVQNRMIGEQKNQIMELSNLERDLNNMKFDFYTHVSHEIRTPLSLIKAPLQTMMDLEDDEVRRKYLERIDRNVTNIQNLVDQVMDLRKIDVHELELQATSNDIVSFTEKVVRSFTDLAESAQIELQYHTDWKEFIINFDKVKLERALMNLISNAIKFTPKGGSVMVQLRNTSEMVKINIQDTGKGIPNEHLNQIFNPFYQVPETRYGTGIGLTIVKEYIQLHGGTIEVGSELGKGTWFTISIPFNGNIENHSKSPDTEKRDQYVRDDAIAEAEINTDNKYRILIIDDNKEIVDYLSEELMDKYTIYTAINGEIGLNVCQDKQPDLVIADIMMPVMDGIEFCKHLKNRTDTSHIPVILLTAKNAEEHQIEGYQTGADDYIIKPFNLKVLEARLRNIIIQREKLYEIFNNSIQDIHPKEVSNNKPDQAFLEKA